MAQTRVKLIAQGCALLAPPILFVLWVFSGLGVRWFALHGSNMQGSLFSANTMVLALIWLGHMMILINLVCYMMHAYSDAFKGDANSGDRAYLLAVWWISVIVAVLISAFIVITTLAFFGNQIPLITFGRVIVINHWFLLAIFIAFLLMDVWVTQSAKKRKGRSTNDLIAARFSIWLVSSPSICVTVLALLLHHILVHNPDWLLIFDKPEILSSSKYGYITPPVVHPSSQEKPLFDLFVSGLNVGLTMASIMVSQMAFFVIEVFRNSGEKEAQ